MTPSFLRQNFRHWLCTPKDTRKSFLEPISIPTAVPYCFLNIPTSRLVNAFFSPIIYLPLDVWKNIDTICDIIHSPLTPSDRRITPFSIFTTFYILTSFFFFFSSRLRSSSFNLTTVQFRALSFYDKAYISFKNGAVKFEI